MEMDYARRVAALRTCMQKSDVELCIVASPSNVAYFTGFRMIYYPRPVLLFVDKQATTLVVPRCDEHEARATGHVTVISAYFEQHGVSGPSSHLECLVEQLRGIPEGSQVGLEGDVCPTQLADLVTSHGFRIGDVGPSLARLRESKDQAELELLRSAAELTNLAVAASMQSMAIGVTELEVDASGNAAACGAAANLDFPTTVELFAITSSGAERTTFPHTLSTNRRLALGEVVSHSRQVGLGGYRAEMERTIIVSRASLEQKRVFNAVRAAQQTAIEAVRPGAKCSDVDRLAREVLATAGLDAFALHRTGHGLGLATEWPYLRFDNPKPLEEGMVVTVEPGVYLPGLGGFRHSDTLAVTADGAEVLTSFPTDLASLTIN
jgi:Xaa-Pro dipeptidase